MWMLILAIAGIVVIAAVVAMVLFSSSRDEGRRKRAPRYHPDQTGRWEDAGSERRNAR